MLETIGSFIFSEKGLAIFLGMGTWRSFVDERGLVITSLSGAGCVWCVLLAMDLV